MHNYRLKKLVIKPTLACTANCSTCSYRKELHRQLGSSDSLSMEQWLKILYDAKDLGVETLDISGGEPTLYKQLPDLIKIGQQFGWHVNINSNGSLITHEYAIKLLDSGLNSIHISLYSSDPTVHDLMRGSPGLWYKATNAIKIFSDLENSYPKFKVRTQTLICRENYLDLPELFKLHYELGSNSIALSYLEGDFEKKSLLNKSEIKEFRTQTIPGLLLFCDTLNNIIKDQAIDTVKNIFHENILTLDEWSNGLYQPSGKGIPPCTRPQEFTILLANGDVHPCNMIEYCHSPVMGNLFKQSLSEIWFNDIWNEFRCNLFDNCQFCPINLYMNIPLRCSKEKVASQTKRFFVKLTSFIKYNLGWNIKSVG